MKLYLEIKENTEFGGEAVGLFIRVEVSSVESASTIRDQLVSQFFSGVEHTDQIHYHYTDRPCTIEPLP